MPSEKKHNNAKTALLGTYFAFSISLSLPVSALDCTWGGGIGNWTDTNWTGCPGSYPSTADNATIGTGSVTQNTGQTVQSLNQSNGTLSGAGNLNISGQTTLSGGVQSGDGTTRAEGGLLINGNFMDIRENRTLVNADGQTGAWTAGGLRLLNTGSTLVNESGAQFNISADNQTLYGTGLFDNQGQINVALSDALQQVTLASQFSNDGTVNAQTGELRIGGAGTHTGVFTSDADGILNFSGHTQTFTATSSIDAEQVRFTSLTSGAGNFSINGAYSAANTRVEGNTVHFNTTATTGSLTQTGGTLSGLGTLTASGITTLSGGVQSGDGTTRAEGGLLINGSFMDLRENRTLVNAGGQTGTWTSGGLRLLNTGSTLVNESGAQFNISGETRSQTGSGSFINNGTITVNTVDNTQTISTSNLTNNGHIDVQQGTLNATGLEFANDGSIRVASGAHMSSLRDIRNNTQGLFTGDGIIDPGQNFTFTNAGSINPGDGIGSLTVDGDLFMESSSIFNVELGGSNTFDLLSVTGESTLDGTLNVYLTDGFLPEQSQTFDILLTDILLGEFSSVVSMNQGFEWYVTYIENPNGQDIARLGLTAVPLPAAGWLLLSGLGLLVGFGRRRSA